MLINLTPHAVTFRINGQDTTIAPSGTTARLVDSASVPGNPIDGIPVTRRSPVGRVEGIPDPVPGAVYLVSTIVLNALFAEGCRRQDVVAPGTGPTDNPIRDERGQIAAVTRLIGLPPQ